MKIAMNKKEFTKKKERGSKSQFLNITSNHHEN